MPTAIYHFTHIDNLESILGEGVLLCPNHRPAYSVSVSFSDLQKRRSRKSVPCEPRGTLHDYVPFYFAPRSPMMFTLFKGNVPHFQGDIHDLVYLVSSVEKIRELGYSFAFTDGHALMALSNFYNDIADMNRLDWRVLTDSMWKNTDEDNDRERRRQAEFLVKGQVALEAFREFGVYSPEMAKRVVALVKRHTIKVSTLVRKSWYY